MSEKLYEDLDIKDDHLYAGLEKIVDAINYDTNKVEKTLYRLEVTKDYALSRVSKESLDAIIVKIEMLQPMTVMFINLTI